MSFVTVFQLLAVCQLVVSIKNAGAVPAATAGPAIAAGPAGQAAAGWRTAVTNAQASDDVVFSSGTIPTDLTGQPVAAHEGWLLLNEDTYLWYGSSQKQNVTDGVQWDWLSDGFRLYTSHDLSSWKLRATVFTAADVPAAVRQRLLGSSNAPLRLERPKVLYNAAHRYYVLVFSVGSLDRSRAEVGWAVSVSHYGPFKFDSTRQPGGLPSWDLTVASDKDTDAWLARTVPGTGIVISKLNADFLDSAGCCAVIPATQPTSQHSVAPHMHGPHATSVPSVHNSAGSPWLWRSRFRGSAAAAQQGPHHANSTQHEAAAATHAVPHAVGSSSIQDRPQGYDLGLRGAAVVFGAKSRDAGSPCLFKFKGKWYLLAAHQTGWSPTKAVLYVNDGSSPCDESSWRQLPSPAQGPGASHTFESTPAFVYAHTFEGSDQVVLVYFGDRWSPSQPAGPSNASYVWLPLVPQTTPGAQPDSLQLLNLNTWRLGDFRAPSKLQSS